MDKMYRDTMLEYVRGLEQELAEIRQLIQSPDSQSKISRMVYRTSDYSSHSQKLTSASPSRH